MIKIKRVFEKKSVSDGFRVLVDRLWPRGLSKEGLRLDLWAKELAPSAALRNYYHHDPKLWAGFQIRYRAELKKPAAASLLETIVNIARKKTVTLLFASREPLKNNAAVLQKIITARLK